MVDVMPKPIKRYTILIVTGALIVLFIQLGRYALVSERIVSENDPSRKLIATEVEPIEVDLADLGEKMAQKRIVAGGFIDNPNLLTQIEINRIKELSVLDRKLTLDYYRVFLHPSTPNKKALVIELETATVTIKTTKDFDEWALTLFAE